MTILEEAEKLWKKQEEAKKAFEERARKKKGNGKDPGGEEEPEPEQYPAPLDGIAYHGLAGEIVNLILPQSESDPAALLFQTLTAFGALAGRGAFIEVESTKHHPNLFMILVGGTSKARKGTSWDRVLSIFELVLGWVTTTTGLSTGEGFKYMVRDARPRPKRYARRGRVKGDPAEEYDDDNDEQYQGVADKRLLVTEPEFAMVLRNMARQGNTLSGTLRQAFDTGNLNVCTRKDPIRSSGAHVSIIGHVTPEELRQELTQTDMANGLANRFLLCCAKRSKVLPMGGGPLDEQKVNDIAQRLAEAAGKAKNVGLMPLTEPARKLWESVYPGLSEGKPGLVGAMTARSEALARRWAIPYALMGGQAEIGVEHLEAALECVAYSERTVRYMWPSGGSSNPAVSSARMRQPERRCFAMPAPMG